MIDIVCCTDRYCLLHIALLRCTQRYCLLHIALLRCTQRYCLLHIPLLRCTQMLEALRQSRLLHLNERVRAELAERTSLQQVGPGACNTSVQHAAHPRACARMCVRACVRSLERAEASG
jgi:hypothetical protein